MPLYEFPVVVPYQIPDETEGVARTVGIQTVATAPQAAAAVALVLGKCSARLRHPGKRPVILGERAKVGRQGQLVTGIYAYVFTRSPQVTHFTLPARIDQNEGEVLEQTLAGLDPQVCLGVILDCVHLSYINSRGLAAFAGSSSRLNMHLFRVPKPIEAVFDMTGIKQLLNLHPDLMSSLGTMEASVRV